MRCVGIARRGSPAPEVADLLPDGRSVRVITTLDQFWDEPRRFLGADSGGEVLSRGEVTFVPPVPPDARIMCVGLNYRDHVAEGDVDEQSLPTRPTLFARWVPSLSVDGAEITVPADEHGLDWEGEVVAWIGSTLREVTPAAALAGVVGYSTFNDLTAREAQKTTSQWTVGKNADGSGPLGPMVPAAEVGDLRHGLRIRTRVNGRTVQDSTTDKMIHDVGTTLAYISRTMTLRPGDLLATGTPAGVGYARRPPWLLKPGDSVEVEVERLGVLRNTIVAAESALDSGGLR